MAKMSIKSDKIFVRNKAKKENYVLYRKITTEARTIQLRPGQEINAKNT